MVHNTQTYRYEKKTVFLFCIIIRLNRWLFYWMAETRTTITDSLNSVKDWEGTWKLNERVEKKRYPKLRNLLSDSFTSELRLPISMDLSKRPMFPILHDKREIIFASLATKIDKNFFFIICDANGTLIIWHWTSKVNDAEAKNFQGHQHAVQTAVLDTFFFACEWRKRPKYCCDCFSKKLSAFSYLHDEMNHETNYKYFEEICLIR